MRHLKQRHYKARHFMQRSFAGIGEIIAGIVQKYIILRRRKR